MDKNKIVVHLMKPSTTANITSSHMSILVSLPELDIISKSKYALK